MVACRVNIAFLRCIISHCRGLATRLGACKSCMAEQTPKLKYGQGADLSDPNTSHSRMVALVGANKSVLEFGCASGYMSRVLRERGCRVTGVDNDCAAAEQA